VPTAAAYTEGEVLRSRFRHGREYLLGVEEEYMLVDRDGLALAAAVERVLEASAGAHGKRELYQCQIEVATPPCVSAREALDRLASLRGELVEDARAAGAVIAAAGAHPFSLAEEQAITDDARYEGILDALRYPARHSVVFGMHVHVAVGGADKTLHVMEGLLAELPLLVALSASSPFWRGADSGLASTRLLIGSSMPHTGTPPAFDSFDEFCDVVARLRRAGALADASYLWWDVRPHPRLGTLELRALDVQPRLTDTAALAGLVQALVRSYGKAYDRGDGIARTNRLVAAENRWLAIRHGLDARFVVDGDNQVVPARELVERTLERVAPDLAALGAEWIAPHLAAIASRGTSSERQRGWHAAGASLRQVVERIAAETAGAA
jgi:carboxylate-amine ligase